VSDYGWVPDPQAVEAVLASLPLPVASDMHWMRGTGEKAVALLHLSVAKVAGSFPIRLQTIGDCVSQGCACAVDVVKCVEIDLPRRERSLGSRDSHGTDLRGLTGRDRWRQDPRRW
jgi:hypothetical protein